ncbi:MAG: MurR/RpiR family transcriptional regulator [Pseudomonadota bacterium]
MEVDVDETISVRSVINEHLADLSDAERRLANYTLNHYRECALLGINELAQACSVSNATVNRYARAIGFDGYHDYRKALKAEATRLTSPTIFERGLHDGNVEEARIRSIEEDIRNLQGLGEVLSSASFEATVSALCSARRVFVFGQGSSTYLAGYFAFNLQGLGVDATELSSRSGIEGIARTLLQIKENDLVIPIAFPRFTKLTIDLTVKARKQGCSVHSLTSSVEGPLAKASDVVLLAPPRVELHSGSGVTAMAAIEALLSALTNRFSEAGDAAKALGTIIDEHVS